MTTDEIQHKANLIRKDVIEMLIEAKSGHPGGALGLAEVLAVLFFGGVMDIDANNPNWPERDRLVLSNGHTCPGLYAVMAEAECFPREELMTLRKLGSRLQGHPHRGSLPGLETTSGPLGCGLSQGIGMAWAIRLKNSKMSHVFVITSDGEHDEGNTWEGIMLAAKYRIANLTMIVDRNRIQIDGRTEEVMPLGDLRAKYEAFGWKAVELDGHNIEELIRTIKNAKADNTIPWAIIANTIPGKSVSYMENNYLWHGKAPGTEEEIRKAREDVAKL
jgi:transketolase